MDRAWVNTSEGEQRAPTYPASYRERDHQRWTLVGDFHGDKARESKC